MNEGRKILLDERTVPEDKGILGSKTTSIGLDGAILKETRLMFCDACGLQIKDVNPALCSCGRKVCPSCTVFSDKKVFCRECAKQIIDISKQDFFLLHGISRNASLTDIKRCSSMSSESLEDSLSTLIGHELITSKGISLFTRYSVTDRGLAILATASQIYLGEGDINQFLAKLEETIDEGLE
jgi:hypothetical protein